MFLIRFTITGLGTPAMSAHGEAAIDQGKLVELMFRNVGLSKREVKDIIETFFDGINDALGHGEATWRWRLAPHLGLRLKVRMRPCPCH